MTRTYLLAPERVHLAGLSGVARQRREKLCASQRAEYAWLNVEPCIERVPLDSPYGQLRTAGLLPTLNSAEAVSTFLHQAAPFAGKGVEYAVVVAVNKKLKPLGVGVVGKGGRDSLMVDPVRVVLPALLLNASGYIFAHNHPSGNTDPSQDDIELTKNLKKIGQLLQLAFLDHLIVTDDPEKYMSFLERGLLP